MTPRRLSLAAVFLTAVGTLVLHFVFIDHPFGWGLLALTMSVLVAIQLVAAWLQRDVNLWAYLFLGPVFLCVAASILFANPVVRVVAPLGILVSLGFFAYWLTAPRASLRAIQSLWPLSFFFETVIPDEGSAGVMQGLSVGDRERRILTGLLIAAPFLAIIGTLFLTADAFFAKTIADALSFTNIPSLFFKLIVDFVFAAWFVRVLWCSVTRSLEHRHPRWAAPMSHKDGIVIASFLVGLNLLFLAFIAFQFVYLFGGQAIIEAKGITYAAYAREGFFQLFTVAVLVFGILTALYRLTELKSLAVRMLSVLLVAQTGVVIASAVKRMLLYVDAYGLSVLRWWALAGLIAAGLGLLLLVGFALARRSSFAFAKTAALVGLYLGSALLLFNVEGFVMRYNVERALEHPEKIFDAEYALTFSSDAMPELVEFLEKLPATSSLKCEPWKLYCMGEALYRCPRTNDICVKETVVRYLVEERLPVLRKRMEDPLNRVWADERALAALERLNQ